MKHFINPLFSPSPFYVKLLTSPQTHCSFHSTKEGEGIVGGEGGGGGGGRCSLFRSEFCCNHTQSDDLIPLNTALLEVPRRSATKEMSAEDGVNWRLNASVLHLKNATSGRHIVDVFLLLFPSNQRFSFFPLTNIWVAGTAVFHILCSRFNWLVLHPDTLICVEFSLSLPILLVPAQIRAPS